MIDHVERASIIFFKIFVYPVHGCRESQRKGPDWWVPITTPLTKTKKKVGIFFQKKKLFFYFLAWSWHVDSISWIKIFWIFLVMKSIHIRSILCVFSTDEPCKDRLNLTANYAKIPIYMPCFFCWKKSKLFCVAFVFFYIGPHDSGLLKSHLPPPKHVWGGLQGWSKGHILADFQGIISTLKKN